MTSWQGAFLESIADELKNIREILERLSTTEQSSEVENRLEFVKKIIEEHIDDALCGIYFTRNYAGDRMVLLDKQFGIEIEICYEYEYFEIFGLTDSEQDAIESFYDELSKARRRGK